MTDSSSLRPKKGELNQASVRRTLARVGMCVFVCSRCAFTAITCFLVTPATAADPPIHPAIPG